MFNFKFYKISGKGWSKPVYYAAYNFKDAKNVGYSDNNSQFLLEVEEVDLSDIPENKYIHNSNLNFYDNQTLTKLRS